LGKSDRKRNGILLLFHVPLYILDLIFPPPQKQSLQINYYQDLSFNSLQGEIPPTLFEIKGLQKLILGTNSLTGSLPDTISKATSLQRLSVSHNALSGHIPSAIGGMKAILSLLLNDNQFSGTIPKEFYSELPLVAAVDLSNNNLTGHITEDILTTATKGSLAYFSIEG